MTVRPARLWSRVRSNVAGLFRLDDHLRELESRRRSRKTRLGMEQLETREVPAAVLVKDVQHFSDPATAFIPFGNTSTTLTLAHPVAMNRTLVTGTTSHPADWAGNSVARFELIDTNGSPETAEAVRVTRGGNGGNSISGRLDFSVDVTEFLSGVTVEQKQISIGSGSTSAAATLGTSWVSDRSFVVLSQSIVDDTPNSDSRWATRGSLTGSGSTLTLSRSQTGAEVIVAAQVLTLDAGNGSKVQAGQLTLSSTSAASSYTTTPGAGDLLFFSADAPAAATGVEVQYRIRGSASGGTVSFSTLAAGGATVNYFVVSIAGATVQTGDLSFAAATTDTGGSSSLYTQSAALLHVDPSRSIASVSASGGDSSRRDTLGDTSFKAVLTNGTTLTLSRADRVDTPDVPTYGNGSAKESVATASWWVVEWPKVELAPLGLARGGEVRIGDGAVGVEAVDLSSGGFGMPWGQSRTWSNDPRSVGYAGNQWFGNGWIANDLPSLVRDGTTIKVVQGTDVLTFDVTPDGTAYVARFFVLDKLSRDAASKTFTLTRPDGTQIVFRDFDGSWPTQSRGQFDSQTSPAGFETAVTARTGDGKPLVVTRSGSGVGQGLTNETYTFEWVGNRASSVTLERFTVPMANQVIRKVVYSYYGASESQGNEGDLKTAEIRDAAGNVLDTMYYRYHTGGSGGLKMAFGAAAFERLKAAALGDPFGAADTAAAVFADLAFTYDADKRVATRTVAGAGGTAGQGTYTYSYSDSGLAAGFNVWNRAATVLLPDGTQTVAYANAFAEPMLSAVIDGGNQWVTYTKYDDAGRAVLTANPSAVTGYDATKADLVNYVGGNAQYLRDDGGLITIANYGTSTTATSSAAGNVLGYYAGSSIRHGETGQIVPQDATQYVSYTAAGLTVFPVASTTIYRNDNGTGAQTTTYGRTWYFGTVQPYSVTTTLPIVTAAQNGPGTASVTTTVFDEFGRSLWTRDPDGRMTYSQKDLGTGAVRKFIDDVDTSLTGTFVLKPTGWDSGTDPMHLTSLYERDLLGRTVQTTDANGNVTYTVFKDFEHEVRTYRGWVSGAPTTPVEVVREDRPRSYIESFTASAAPSVDGDGRPTGGETPTLESMSRTFVNAAGQVVESRDYFDVSLLAYDPDAELGIEGLEYDRTQFGYDSRGRRNREVSAAGTVSRTVYDLLGRATSTWVGTDDTPTAGAWSPGNLAGTNTVQVEEYEYDNGGVGDSNLTKSTAFPGLGADPRVTQMWYDWRNRRAAIKEGVQSTEATDVNRPLTVFAFDNLGSTIETSVYDGDQIEPTFAHGVYDDDFEDYLRSRTTAETDEWGRTFRTSVLGVDPNTGVVSGSVNTEAWFDLRGNLVKTAAPGGLVTKFLYDGASRTVASYTSDGGGDSSWSDALTVTGDTVLSQFEWTLDNNGNAILTTTRERFHDASGTGPLGSPSSGVPARVSYQVAYFDAADRTTRVGNAGTNGGSPFTRPNDPTSLTSGVLQTVFGYGTDGMLASVIDPNGNETLTEYDDFGRTVKVREDSGGIDKTTLYSYGPAGLISQTSVNPGSSNQITGYVYGVSPGTGSAVASNEVAAMTQWPDPTTGAASAGEQESFTINALGQMLTSTDRNGNVHAYSYDVLGRLISDTVTTLGASGDGSVRRIEYGYDGQGNLAVVTSYATVDGSSSLSTPITSQVKREFNKFGQMTVEWQQHGGAVTGSSPKVEYAYTEAISANDSRLTKVTYPSGYELDYNYASGLDNNISRLSSLSDSTGVLESYQYMGLGTVVVRSHPQPGVDLSYVKQGMEPDGSDGDQYAGLDEYGRIADQRWLKSGADVDRRQYGHDNNSNRTSALNVLNALTDLYGYDGLNQLTSFERRPDVGPPNSVIDWDYDSLGNWNGVDVDGVTEFRTHNAQNEIASLSYDENGNTIVDDRGQQLVYDAWNRLVQIFDNEANLVREFTYDGFGRRDTVTDTLGTTVLFYSDQWQVLEETVGGAIAARYVWSPAYVDALVVRERASDTVGTLDERLWAVHDANWNVVALVDDSGAVVERMAYDPYGAVTILNPDFSLRSGGTQYAWTVLFQGMSWDAGAGMYGSSRLRGSGYSPTLGRWLSNDPGGYAMGDPNLYRFVGNGPTGVVDPSGLQSRSDLADLRRYHEERMKREEAKKLASQPSQPTGANDLPLLLNPRMKHVYNVGNGILEVPRLALDIGSVAGSVASAARGYEVAEVQWHSQTIQGFIDINPHAAESPRGVGTAMFYSTPIGGAWSLGTAIGSGNIDEIEFMAGGGAWGAGPAGGRYSRRKALIESLAENNATTLDPSAARNPLLFKTYQKQLASDFLFSQARTDGIGEVIAGITSETSLRDTARLAKMYGGDPSHWVKMRSKSMGLPADSPTAGRLFSNQEIHWYENLKTGQKVEFKTKLQ